MKKDPYSKMGDTVKNVLTQLIKNISIVAIFILLFLVVFASLGAEFSLEGFFKSSLGVQSVLLGVGTIILYELWCRNGETNGKSEQDYIDTVKSFQELSKNINPEKMQLFIEAEKQRRYKVEEKQIIKDIENIDKQLEKKTLSKMARRYLLRKRQKLEDHVIVVDMPYKVSEEIEGLRVAIKDPYKKEYKPNAMRYYLGKRRVKKYFSTVFFAVFSVNVIIMGGIKGTWLDVILALAIAVCSIMMAVVGGFVSGYRSITIFSFGVYQTANEFINKAISWCTKEGYSLYYEDGEKEESDQNLLNFIPELIDEPEDLYRPTISEVFGIPEVIIE